MYPFEKTPPHTTCLNYWLNFTNATYPQLGIDFALKVINWDPNTVVRLQFWDIAGQERAKNMTRYENSF